MFRLCYNASRIRFRVQRSRRRAASGNAGKIKYRGVAQLVARLLWEQEARGSSPRTPTSEEKALKAMEKAFGAFSIRRTGFFFASNRDPEFDRPDGGRSFRPKRPEAPPGLAVGETGCGSRDLDFIGDKKASRPDRWTTTGPGGMRFASVSE